MAAAGWLRRSRPDRNDPAFTAPAHGGITERDPDAPDSLSARGPKSPMIARPAGDNLKPLHVRRLGRVVNYLAMASNASLREECNRKKSLPAPRLM